MISVENINILQEVYPETWKRVEEFKYNINDQLLGVEITRKENETLFVEKDNKKIYLHSKYDPVKEAEIIVSEYKAIEEDTTVIFYGIGLGYHLDVFIKKYPDINYYIYEPIPEIAKAYLSYKSIKGNLSLRLKDIIIGNDETDIRSFLSKCIDKSNNNVLHIPLNSHINIFNDEYGKFIQVFKEIIEDKKISIGTNFAFQKKWIVNSLKNFSEVLSTPNIIIEKKGVFKDKTAIIVAAGPSLNEEIDNLKYIKENKLAYIFSVGSAISTLIYNEIYPDVVCTYDPTESTDHNKKVFGKVEEQGITQIPMIFGSSVGYETQNDYPGKKYHMITSQDTISSYYLKDTNDNNIRIVNDAPSIAVVTFQLLSELGFSTIILVGQNLGYKGSQQYSEGIEYSLDLTGVELEKAIRIKDVYGNEMLTNKGFNAMRQQIEYYIKQLPNINVVNTTKDGAHIEGTIFMELQDVIDGKLKETIVEDNWLEGNSTDYDKEHLELRLRDMDRHYRGALRINKEYKSILNRIEKAIKIKKFSQAEILYVKLDKELRRLERNDYYKIFILPMNRVRYKMLTDSIDSLNDIKEPYAKGKKIVEDFRSFIDICVKDIEMLDPIYEQMKEDILNYIQGEVLEGK